MTASRNSFAETSRAAAAALDASSRRLDIMQCHIKKYTHVYFCILLHHQQQQQLQHMQAAVRSAGSMSGRIISPLSADVWR